MLRIEKPTLRARNTALFMRCDVTISNAEITARRFVSRKTQADAYRKAYPSSLKWKPEVVHNKASTFLPTVGFGKGLSRFRTQLQNGTNIYRRPRDPRAVLGGPRGRPYPVRKGRQAGGQGIGQNRALELLGRHFGIFNDKMTHSFDFSSLTDEQLRNHRCRGAREPER